MPSRFQLFRVNSLLVETSKAYFMKRLYDTNRRMGLLNHMNYLDLYDIGLLIGSLWHGETMFTPRRESKSMI